MPFIETHASSLDSNYCVTDPTTARILSLDNLK